MTTERFRYQPSTDPFYQAGAAPGPSDVPEGTFISSDTQRTQRIPPGQVRTKKWPVLHATTVPNIRIEKWNLQVDGLVERPLTLDTSSFASLPRASVIGDFHCVTRWSRLGNLWEGVNTATITQLAGVLPAARFVMVEAYDGGWTTNLPIADFLAGDVLLADKHDGRLLMPSHGGPVRLVVPRLYAWKSAKWIRRITFVSNDSPGYWESLGYHDRGDPWLEQRFR